MKQSQLFGQTTKETPKGVENISTALLLRAGFIERVGAGIYAFLPLGLKVLDKITGIIREEMVGIGGQELLMPALHPISYWEKTGRDKAEVGFRTTGHDETEYILGWTHEEIVTSLAKKYIQSYKDLPKYLFQIQTKFRNEPRAKAGLLRTREFLMKDLYSFHTEEKDLDEYYRKVKGSYERIFNRTGLGKETYYTYASGGEFSEFSHEFQALSEAGEDIIYICDKCQLAINREIIEKIKVCPECGEVKLREEKSIEIANIFKLGTRYSKAFDLRYLDDKGQSHLAIMGCYGIGPARILATAVELSHDEQGIIWPSEIAPFKVHLLALPGEGVKEEAEKLYEALQKEGIGVLYDDRNETAGVKFSEADLIGCPIRLTLSSRTLEKKSVELKWRDRKESQLISLLEITKEIKKD